MSLRPGAANHSRERKGRAACGSSHTPARQGAAAGAAPETRLALHLLEFLALGLVDELLHEEEADHRADAVEDVAAGEAQLPP